MKIYQSWKRNTPTTDGYSLTVTYVYSSRYLYEIEDVEKKLWQVKPLSKMWGIGSRYEISLKNMGFKTVGDIANCDVNILKKRFGIMGEELWYHTHGIDMSLIQDKKKRIYLFVVPKFAQLFDYNR